MSVFIIFELISRIPNNNVQHSKNIHSSWVRETGYYTLGDLEHSEQTVALHKTADIYQNLWS